MQTEYEAMLKLALTYHTHGAPAGRVEEAMTLIGSKMGIESMWGVSPTNISVTFGNPFKLGAVSISLRTGQSLGSILHLDRVERLMVRIIEGDISFEEVPALCEEIERLPPYGARMKTLASALFSSTATACFFGGGYKEMILSFVLGGLAQMYRTLGNYYPVLGDSTTFIICVFCSMFTALIIGFNPMGMCFGPTVLGAVIWELPGIGIALSMRELASKNFIAGTARLLASLLVAFSIGFGLLLGLNIVYWLPPNIYIATVCPNKLGDEWILLFLPISIIGFSILLDAEVHRWPGMMVISIVGFGTSYGLEKFGLVNIITIVASFAVCTLGRMISRYRNTSSTAYVFAGTLVLLPGGVSVKGVFNMLHNDPLGGLDFGTKMLMIGLSLCIGSMLSHIVPAPVIGKVQSW